MFKILAASYSSIPVFVRFPASPGSPTTGEWVLMDVADSSQLRSTKRLEKRKAEQGNKVASPQYSSVT